MSSLRLANSRFRGITVEASKRFVGDRICPLTGDTITIEGNLSVNGSLNGNIEIDGLSLSSTGTSLGENTPEATTLRNTLIGARAGENIITDDNTALGFLSGTNSTGGFNVIVGAFSGTNNTGSNSTMVGNSAGGGNTGSFSTMVGASSGADNTGSLSTMIGLNSGRNNSGDNSTILGTQAGFNNQGNDSVLIGYEAGYSNTDDNKLIIGNSSTSELIAGDFSAETIELNGSVSLGKNDNSSVVNFNRAVLGAAGASAGYIDIEVAGVPYKLQVFVP